MCDSSLNFLFREQVHGPFPKRHQLSKVLTLPVSVVSSFRRSFFLVIRLHVLSILSVPRVPRTLVYRLEGFRLRRGIKQKSNLCGNSTTSPPKL